MLALVGGCGRGPRPQVYVPAGPAVVEVVEHDYGYALDRRGGIPTGRVVFRMVSRSGLSHDLSLVALPEDLPPIVEQLRSPERRAVTTLVRLQSHPAGSTDAFAVDLAAGRYALLCFEVDGDGETHAVKGMAMELRVGPVPGQPGAGP
ncbi:MAG: hypothetical protein WKF86_01390 [Acidimicrobiales bacterium]